MITVNIFGGLGNQMFQYALGRHLSIKNKDSLTLRFIDVGGFSKRDYVLGCFKLASGVRVVTGPSTTLRVNRIPVAIWRKLQVIFGREETVRESGFPFDPKILELRGNVHLFGYWQSEKYFRDIRETILDDFTFVRPLDRCNKKLLEEIKSSNSVSVHVRRGDYVIDRETREFHGVYGPDYYRKAVEVIAKKVRNPVFYFFSDDIGWVKKNLKTKFKNVYVDWNTGEQSYMDMQLMSHCKHSILANSSFSWWGAWLNQNRGKIVVAPEKWFQDPTTDTRDLIPKGWLKI